LEEKKGEKKFRQSATYITSKGRLDYLENQCFRDITVNTQSLTNAIYILLPSITKTKINISIERAYF